MTSPVTLAQVRFVFDKAVAQAEQFLDRPVTQAELDYIGAAVAKGFAGVPLIDDDGELMDSTIARLEFVPVGGRPAPKAVQ